MRRDPRDQRRRGQRCRDVLHDVQAQAGRRLPRRRLHQHAVRGHGRRPDLRAAQGPPRRRQRRDHRGRQDHPRARRVQRGLRLRPGDDGQLGVHGQPDARVGRPGRRRPARRQGGPLDPRAAAVHLARGRARARRLPRRPRRRGAGRRPRLAGRPGRSPARRAGRRARQAARKPREPRERTRDRHPDPGPHRQLGRRPRLDAGVVRGARWLRRPRQGVRDDARRRDRHRQGVRPPRPRRRRLPDGHEVGLHPAGQPEAEVPRRQRRRVGARARARTSR